ncbi:MAG: PQQ-dependent sugar dehydrogenase [Candidatus Marinimicrobia bacterium]|nr:PQQ-dependent sugar dehydrogenase [Candidatus Neomarinimicrobiota bacterium]
MIKNTLLLLFSSIIMGQSISLSSELVSDGFKKPVFVISYPTDASILYVVEQAGKIIVLDSGQKKSKPFFNINKRVVNPFRPGDERGLLGFAFHPDYENNKKFYINYIDNDGHTIVSEFIAQSKYKADHNSERVLLKLEQPYGNHNGGHIEFGKDGYLYIAIGDGGAAGDPLDSGQDLTSLFGKVIRIDINGSPYSIPKSNPFYGIKNAREEIWAWGLRNVWRFSFDKKTGDIYYGDVGQNKWEEVNFEPASSSGGNNYGWRHMEASYCFEPKENCKRDGMVLPIIEYPNDAYHPAFALGRKNQLDVEGCSVTGGYVYRGKKLKGFEGVYFFGDYCSGNIWSFKVKDGKAAEFKNRTDEINIADGEFTNYISSFGQDADGEIYIVDYNGAVYKIIAK